MSPQTVKLLMMFFLATALLNITNYLFYLLYDPPSTHAMKAEPWEAGISRRFSTRHRVVRTARWTSFLLAKGEETHMNEERTGDEDYRDQSSEVSRFDEYSRELDRCPQKPPGLGPINIGDVVSLEAIEKLYDTLAIGGAYEESACTARQSVAIIIPRRGKKTDLLKFLYTLHPFLMKQQLDYQMFVVEQFNTSEPLNYGKLLNAGFTEAQRIQGLKKDAGWKCIVFHDLELVPVDSRNLYRCSKNPHQLVSLVNNRSYEYPFGGAFAINPKQFTKVNGFSNFYSGNGAVYDDLYKRLQDANYTITRSSTFGKYSNYTQIIDVNQTRFQTIQTSSPLNLIDGLTTLTYKLDSIDAKQLYTLISVDVDDPPGNVTEKIWNRLFNQISITTQKQRSEPVI